MQKFLSAIVLVLSNLLPIAGHYLWGWDLRSLLIVYWSENLIIGFFNVLKMRKAAGPIDTTNTSVRLNGLPIGSASKSFLISFFIMHFGMFSLVHGVFVIAMTASLFGATPENLTVLILSCLLEFCILFASHAYSYYANFIGRHEYLQASPDKLFIAPYSRIVIVHIAVIVGSSLLPLKDQDLSWPIFIFVGLKTLIDLIMHLLQHRKSYHEDSD